MEFCLILKPFSDAADGTVGRGGKKKKEKKKDLVEDFSQGTYEPSIIHQFRSP